MLGGVSASAAVKTLTDVTVSNVARSAGQLQASIERGRVAPTADERNQFTINRLDRNQSDIEATLDRSRPIPRGALLNIQA